MTFDAGETIWTESSHKYCLPQIAAMAAESGFTSPAQWIDAGFEGVLPRGTPVAQCFPVERAALDLAFEAFTAEDARRYDSTARALLSRSGVYRARYRARRVRSTAE